MAWVYLILLVCSINSIAADQPKIVIIGAGSSGIAAASKLFEYGFDDVTILEAENRIGGRVFTKRMDDYWIDIGGQWVDGTDNVVFEMASRLDLIELPTGRSDKAFIHAKGIPLPGEINDKVNQASGTLDQFVRANLNATSGSLGPYLKRAAIAALDDVPELNETLRNELVFAFQSLYLRNKAASSWNKLSVSIYTEFWKSNDSRVSNWKDKGYGVILDVLMKKYPNPEEELPVLNNTFLNVEVVNVNDGLIEGKAVVETTTGQKYIADHVIVTPSLGVLKARYETLFTPPLPESKVKNIKGLGYGGIAKLFFSFDEPWWADRKSFILLWDERERREYESNPDTKWILNLTSFSTVEHKPRLLCGWMSGAGVQYMETLSEEDVFNASFGLLNKFFGQMYNITRPVAFERSLWHTNKHFCGTNSYRSTESDEADAWAEQLASPLLVDEKPIILFAGEASNPHHYSTVHGAIETGFREADRLKEIYNDRLSNSTFRT